MLIRSDVVLAGEALRPILRGAVRTEGSRILAVGTQTALGVLPGEVVIDLPGCVLSPGLINAHTHLDYTRVAGRVPMSARGNFVGWLKALNACKSDWSTDDYVASIERGFEMLLAGGTTSAANIVATPEVLARVVPRSPLRIWWFFELVDIRSRLAMEESLAAALSFFDSLQDDPEPEALSRFGLSPHAPYTASVDLYRLAQRCAGQCNAPITTHLAESREESEMFRHAQGPLYDLAASLGRANGDCGHGSPVSHLAEHGALPEKCMAVHLNYIQEYDWPLLRRHGVIAVHCPRSHAYFGHAPFPLERMRAEGIPICLGTDSLASNDRLDMRAEIRQAQPEHPDLTPAEWLRMVTVVPARALGQAGQLGEISTGAFADLVAFRLPEGLAEQLDSATLGDVQQAIIDSTDAPEWISIAGQPVEPALSVVG